MKQCPKCQSIYDDDTLFFCTDDGATLVAPFNREATHLNTPFQQTPVLPTVASNERTARMPTPEVRPKETRQPLFRPLVLVALLIGVLLGTLITVWLLQKPDDETSSSVPPSSTPTIASTPIVEAKKASPTPSPVFTPTPIPTPTMTPTSEVQPECMLYNDKADKSVVVTRSDCDRKDCESDISTMGLEYPNGTEVKVIRGYNVKGIRFTWVKVLLVERNETVWVASSKVRC